MLNENSDKGDVLRLDTHVQCLSFFFSSKLKANLTLIGLLRNQRNYEDEQMVI